MVEVCTRAVQATEGPDLATVVQVLTNGLDRVALAVNRAVGGDA